MLKQLSNKIKKLIGQASNLTTRKNLLVFIVSFGIIGTLALLLTNAATPTTQFEAESASLTGNTLKISDSSASGGQAVTFNAAQDITDNFERQNLGANWSIQIGNVSIVNQSDLGFASQSPAGIATWVGSTLGADHYSEATISSNKTTNMLAQVFVRRRSSDAARYAFHYDGDPNDGITDAWQIKYDGVSTAQTRILTSSTVAGPNLGDTLRIEARGYNPVELRGYRNGELILSATDVTASAITSGQPGVVFRLQLGTSTTYPSPVFESWGAGNL